MSYILQVIETLVGLEYWDITSLFDLDFVMKSKAWYFKP